MTPEERVAYLKSQHRCVSCAKRDERTEAGRVYCSACTAKRKEYAKAKYENYTTKGLCTRCGKTANAGKLCKVCREDATKRQKTHRFRKVVEEYKQRGA